MAPKKIIEYVSSIPILYNGEYVPFTLMMVFLKYNESITNFTYLMDEYLSITIKKTFKIIINYDSFNILCVSEDIYWNCRIPYIKSIEINNGLTLDTYLDEIIQNR